MVPTSYSYYGETENAGWDEENEGFRRRRAMLVVNELRCQAERSTGMEYSFHQLSLFYTRRRPEQFSS